MARTPSRTNVARIAVDCAMALTYVAVMATALVQEAPHEYLGIALFALVVAHLILGRRWFASLGRGRYSALRIMQVATIAGQLVCLMAQAASSLVLSKHAFAFLPALPGAALARSTHMLCSYWGFVFAFAHGGLHLDAARSRLGARRTRSATITWASRVAFAAVVVLGLWSAVELNLVSYLTGQALFAFVDTQTPLALTCARYASVAVLLASTFHYLAALLSRRHTPPIPTEKGQ